MRILITGASGFVASHLIEYISQVVSPVEISGLVRPGSCYSQTKKTDRAYQGGRRRRAGPAVASPGTGRFTTRPDFSPGKPVVNGFLT
ncbi:MAG: hypothetical protein QME28_03610 [Candidatus Saccharicenans sp.]|nr:hypothetical protein [Candidatus Saccharicenans sp.]